MTGPNHPLVAEMATALPELRVVTESEHVAPYLADETEFLEPGRPLAVVFPRSTEDVSAIVRLASRHQVPVVPRGGGTGLSGGANAVDGGVTMVMTAMDRIIGVDSDDLHVVTQPGVITADLERAVEAVGLLYPPDPASHETSVIGGNIAENAGGLRCVKYGVTGNFVLGLEVVLADGEVIRTGGRTVKDVMGYDLTHLFVGSEGTLGIITEATLRLLPCPGPKVTMLAFFPGIREAGDAVSRMTRAGLVPVTLELIDRFVIEAVEGALELGLDREAGAMLMIESDARAGVAEAELDVAAVACSDAGALSQVRARDAAEADALRAARRKAHWSMAQLGTARSEDICVPRSRVEQLMGAIEALARKHGLSIGVFGHAGDGNFHPTFVTDEDDPRGRERIDAVRADLFTTVLAMGGSLSGEHGTGASKRAWLEPQVGARGVTAMRAIKAALDPQGILNPGKVLPD